jgi:hypothetical protein
MLLGIFKLLDAVNTLIKLGVELKESDFYEPSPDHYDSLSRQGFDLNEKWYIVDIPSEKSNELSIVKEEDKAYLLKAVAYVYEETEELGDCSFKERLFYIKGIIPVTSKKAPKPGKVIEFKSKASQNEKEEL